MKSLKIGKEAGEKLGVIQRMFRLLRMSSDSSPFTSSQEDSNPEFSCVSAGPDYQRETRIATLNAELKKGEAEMEWRRRSQLLR